MLMASKFCGDFLARNDWQLIGLIDKKYTLARFNPEDCVEQMSIYEE